MRQANGFKNDPLTRSHLIFNSHNLPQIFNLGSPGYLDTHVQELRLAHIQQHHSRSPQGMADHVDPTQDS